MAKKPQTPASVTIQYEQQLYALQKTIQQQVDSLYNDIINQITPLAAAQTLPSGVFSLDKLPMLENRIDQLITGMNAQIETIVQNGIMGAWQLSNDKNNIFADIRLDKSLIPADQQVQFYDTNQDALQQFLKRKIDGLDLSDRIYRQGETFKAELEAGLGLGISEGQSAAAMGADLKQFLKNPDALFRRVRDAEGNLQLSKNAQAFNPGQGVYRSATKNIQRLTRTETNIAYRTSDNVRYKQAPFILGYQVNTSASHPKLDVCDYMAGDYPNDFVFTGWHPQCLCFAVPILMNEEQFGQYQQLVIAGTDTAENVAAIAEPVSEIPDSAKQWISDNAEKIAGYKKPPFWWQQNSNFIP